MSKTKILNVKIDDLSLEEIVKIISRSISEKTSRTKLLATINPEILIEADKSPDYKKILNKSFLNIAESFGLKLVANCKKIKIKNRVPGIDLIEKLAEISPHKKWRWFFLGGMPGVAKKAANNLQQKIPGIKIVKAESGGNITAANIPKQKKLALKVQKSKADILIVCFGAPKQEMFIDYYKDILGAKIAIGAGGSLDFLAGIKKRAPKFIRKLGLEWLWRLIIEPKRFKRIWTAVVVFPLKVRRSKRTT